MSLREKLKSAIEKNMNPQQLLKYLCPFEVDFHLKIFADRNGHDYALLLGGLTEQLELHPKDIEVLINNALEARESPTKIVCVNAKYEGEVYTCVYIDFPKAEQK